jgi:hypothetical protein
VAAVSATAARPVLAPDEQELLSEQLIEHLDRLAGQIAEQRAVVLDSSGAHRTNARRVLRRLARWADAYMARLHRIRSGGPSCRRCGRYLSFEQLDRQLLAVHCGRCRPATSAAHPSYGAHRRPDRPNEVTT